jgi:hypothetical protein
VTFCSREPQPREEAGHGGHTHPEAPPLPKPLTERCQRGIGVRLEDLAYHRERRWITAGLAASGMRPWCNLARAPAPLYEFLDERAADAKQCREGALGTAVLVISSEDFLTKIEGIGFHICHVTPCLPFRQLQTALNYRSVNAPSVRIPHRICKGLHREGREGFSKHLYAHDINGMWGVGIVPALAWSAKGRFPNGQSRVTATVP